MDPLKERTADRLPAVDEKTKVADLAGTTLDARTPDADHLEPLLSTQINPSVGSQGQFDLLLPDGQHIGVQYAVSPQVTQVLLEAGSPTLSRRLQVCADGIGQRMSQRSGRRVDVFAA